MVSLLIQFCDDRIEIFDSATPLVSYCNIFGGLDIFDVNEIGVDDRTTEGLLTMRVTQAEAREIVQLAISTGQNQLIASDAFGN
ncbi:MAG: hypothetical protein AAFV98_20130 [Chloroflexota bacterium]